MGKNIILTKCISIEKDNESLFDTFSSLGFKVIAAAAAAKLLQLCPTLCNPRDGSPPGSPVPGILQARTPEWAAIDLYAEYIKKLLNWVKHTMESRLPGEILITSDMPMMPL